MIAEVEEACAILEHTSNEVRRHEPVIRPVQPMAYTLACDIPIRDLLTLDQFAAQLCALIAASTGVDNPEQHLPRRLDLNVLDQTTLGGDTVKKVAGARNARGRRKKVKLHGNTVEEVWRQTSRRTTLKGRDVDFKG